MISVLLVLPVTAVLHNRVFFRGMCMLNRIGPDYDLHTIGLWLSRDPSLPLGIVIALIVYFAGRKFGFLRTITAIGVVASVPLVIWVWDIPFTHRIVCSSFHDSKLRLPDGTIVTSLWIYVLSAILFLLLMLIRLRRTAKTMGAAFGRYRI